jgi:hypothetical protein
MYCPQCASNDTTSCRQQRVLILGLERRMHVDLDIMQCRSCRHVYSLCPLQLHCLPSTPSDWDLVGRPGTGHVVMWYDLKFLDLMYMQVGG